MCYKCNVCGSVVDSGTSQRRYIISRIVPLVQHSRGETTRTERTEIEMEIPVCPSCDVQLHRGVSLRELRRLKDEQSPVAYARRACDLNYQEYNRIAEEETEVLVIEDEPLQRAALRAKIALGDFVKVPIKFANGAKVNDKSKGRKSK